MEGDSVLRRHLVKLLEGGQAYMTFDQAVADFPSEYMNVRPPNVSYTPWHLLEHIRITQWDILDFCRNPNYKYMEWPKDYWPASDEKADQAKWDETLRRFWADHAEMRKLTSDPSLDLYTPIPWGEGQTILREILLVTDHNAYHTGEFTILRQVMGTWPPGHK